MSKIKMLRSRHTGVIHGWSKFKAENQQSDYEVIEVGEEPTKETEVAEKPKPRKTRRKRTVSTTVSPEPISDSFADELLAEIDADFGVEP